MEVEKTKINGVLHLIPETHSDHRGFFRELAHQKKLRTHEIQRDFVQINHSHSTQKVLRGLHYQHPKPQGKLISVISGEIFDVAVDLRKNSETYGDWVSKELTAERGNQLYVPPPFAHGFAVISNEANIVYACTDFYEPDYDSGIRWDDPSVNIDWPIKDPILSNKDKSLPNFDEITSPFTGGPV